MRTIQANDITSALHGLILGACSNLGTDVENALIKALETERSAVGREILGQLVENLRLARASGRPCCQDTGMTVVFADVGQDVHIEGGSLFEAVEAAVRSAYTQGYLRKSVLHPLTRKNTGDNTPPVLHTDIVPGDRLTLYAAPKGFGSENASALAMLKPSDGVEGVEQFVVDTVSRSGSSACPPLVIGVGIGGTMEKAALTAKRQLLRDVGAPSGDPELAEFEKRLLSRINALGIGPMGLGGDTTALAVHAGAYPTHIAGLPVAVNIQCHAARHKSITL
ncbi:MAG: fumarate hydratase [Bacillota bacterium]